MKPVLLLAVFFWIGTAAPIHAQAMDGPPEGMTKKMIYLELVSVGGTFKDLFNISWTVLSDGSSVYCVQGLPLGQHAKGEAIPRIILVPGRILKTLDDRRAYRFFSYGTVTPERLAEYKKNNDHLDYPLD